MKTKTKLLAYFGFAMLALCLMSNAGRTYATHYIHVSTGGLQEVTVRGNRESAVVNSDSINVTTTCRSGYNLVISTSVKQPAIKQHHLSPFSVNSQKCDNMVTWQKT